MSPGASQSPVCNRLSAALPARNEGEDMGQPVVHFEIVARDAAKIQSYFAALFG
jgi:hypothetical protein